MGWSWEAVLWSLVADALLFTIAAVLWWVTHAFYCSVITLHENGLSIDSADGLREIPWFMVVELVEVDVSERLPILHFPANLLLPRWHSKAYEIWVHGEPEPRSFNKNTVSDLETFVAHLIDACQRHSIPISQRVDLDL